MADVLRDEDKRWALESAMERSEARERARSIRFVRRTVNARLRKGEHLNLMHQQY
jgi:hypothetical protein